MSSPHPPSPDNNNFHTHPGGPGSHGGMHPNGHTIGSIGMFFSCILVYTWWEEDKSD